MADPRAAQGVGLPGRRSRIARLPRGLLPLGLLLALACAACGSSFYDHSLRIVIVDPPPACPPPWSVLAFSRSDGYAGSEQWASSRLGLSRPDAPYAATIRAEEVHWFWEPPKARNVSVGIYLPCLRADGWWVLDVRPASGVAVPALARFCRWNQLEPAASAPALRSSVMATPTARNDWQLLIRLNLSSGSAAPDA